MCILVVVATGNCGRMVVRAWRCDVMSGREGERERRPTSNLATQEV